MDVTQLDKRFLTYGGQRLLLWAAALLLLALIPTLLIVQGYTPGDDALRHVAKVVSGKAWQEVMIMRDDITIDHNEGWHAVLGIWHRLFGWSSRMLLNFSVISLFMLFNMTGMICVRRPEVWLAALLLTSLAEPNYMLRLMLGRPFLVAMSILLIQLVWWLPQERSRSMALQTGVSTLLFALATWIHGSWYLFALPIAAFFLAGRLKDSILMGCCWVGGVLLGACLTGAPIRFVFEHLSILFGCFGRYSLERMQVGEFRPMDGDYFNVLLIAIVCCRKRGESLRALVRNPLFVMMLLCWACGFKVLRFWRDWGWPAYMLWLVTELKALVPAATWKKAAPRFAVLAVCGLALLPASLRNIDGRWSLYKHLVAMELKPLEHQGWMPGEDGIVYSSDSSVFFCLYFLQPHAPWRYALGYAPSLMTVENLDVLRLIQWNYSDARTFTRWTEKMRPQDRMVFSGVPEQRPAIKALEWHYVEPGFWFGRKR